MHFSGIEALAARLAVIGMSLRANTAQREEVVVFSTISTKEALLELVPEFVRASGHKVNITYEGGSDLSQRIFGGTQGDLFIGPEEFSDPLVKRASRFLIRGRRSFSRPSSTAPPLSRSQCNARLRKPLSIFSGRRPLALYCARRGWTPWCSRRA